MAVKEILQTGDEWLVAEKFDVVDFKDPELSLCLMDLLDTMRKHNLVGLSAPQIGINKNIFITGIRKSINSDTEDFDSLRIFINPEISSFSREEVEMMESCGSVEHSDLFAPVLRSKTVIVKALWADNIEFDLTADGLLARVIQHEIDHLNGILFTEKISDESKRMTAEEYNNLPA